MREIRHLSTQERTNVKDDRDIVTSWISSEIGMGVPYAEGIADFKLGFPVNV
jgi:hypothetical protein